MKDILIGLTIIMLGVANLITVVRVNKLTEETKMLFNTSRIVNQTLVVHAESIGTLQKGMSAIIERMSNE
jgi:hypothetical protein